MDLKGVGIKLAINSKGTRQKSLPALATTSSDYHHNCTGTDTT